MTVIFADGYEDGTTDAWTGENTTTGETITVVDTAPHTGVYCCQHYCNGSATSEAAYLYKTISAASVLYAGMWVKVGTSLPADGQTYRVMYFMVGGSLMAAVMISTSGSTAYWAIRYRSGTSTLYNDTSATSLSLNTWYWVELYMLVDNSGEYKVYVNGVELSDITHTGVDTNNLGNLDTVRIGEMLSSAATEHEIFTDGVVFSDAYIGPPAGVSIPIIMQHFRIINTVIRG